jgi:hypothetical protein
MENQKSSTGISLGMVLFLIFMVLKLVGTIDWSWWWVTSPLWIPIVLVLLVSIIAIAVVISKKLNK